MKTETSIQKWGNGLALRISGLMRDIPHFKAGMPVSVDITEDGFTVKKIKSPKKQTLRFSEAELLDGLTPYNAHADEIADLRDSEIGD